MQNTELREKCSDLPKRRDSRATGPTFPAKARFTSLCNMVHNGLSIIQNVFVQWTFLRLLSCNSVALLRNDKSMLENVTYRAK